MDNRLLELLCCPVTRRPLRAIGASRLEALNAAIAAGAVVKVTGQPVAARLADALIRDDGQVVYPVEDGIPVLLADEAIGTQQIDGFPA